MAVDRVIRPNQDDVAKMLAGNKIAQLELSNIALARSLQEAYTEIDDLVERLANANVLCTHDENWNRNPDTG